MFKGEYGICDECAKHAVDMGIKPQERWIVVKKPYLCKVHNDMRKKGNSPKPIKKAIKKHIKPVKKATGEAEMFKEIWKEREHRCTGCGIGLGDEAKTFHFSHILKKGTYPKFRLDPENIMIECFRCHSTWENGSLEAKKGMKNFKKKLKYIKVNAPALYQKLIKND